MSLGRTVDCGFDLDQEVQQHGILNIRGDLPNKWQKRFCIVKDSFLFLFKEDDAQKIRKSAYFSVKSQGIVPLGDCLISPCSDQTASHGIEITAYSSQLRLIISCESRSQQLAWIRVCSEAARLTSCNFQISEQLIATLETQGLERISLSEKYKKLFEDESTRRRTQQEEAMRLQTEFEHLRQEKHSVEAELHDIEAELAAVRAADAAAAAASAVPPDAADGGDEPVESSDHAAAVAAAAVAANAAETESERAALASQLESERAAFTRQAAELAASLSSLAEEQRARRQAEARLAEAEASLARLDGCIAAEQTSYTEQQKIEMTSDVRQLKSYFESLGAGRVGGGGGGGSGAAGDGVGVGSQQQQQRPTVVRERARRLREQRRSRIGPSTTGADASAATPADI